MVGFRHYSGLGSQVLTGAMLPPEETALTVDIVDFLWGRRPEHESAAQHRAGAALARGGVDLRRDERYVNRRQFAKFLVLTSAGMFVGNV
jgi:hypothetical protein